MCACRKDCRIGSLKPVNVQYVKFLSLKEQVFNIPILAQEYWSFMKGTFTCQYFEMKKMHVVRVLQQQ